MLAVLIDAIRTLSVQQPSDARPQLYRAWVKELAWLQSDDQTYPFSFVNICSALGFDADYVRRSVLMLPNQSRAVRICRYAAKVGESWQRQCAPVGTGLHLAARSARRYPDAGTRAPAAIARSVTFGAQADRVLAAGNL
jgi:hypothetical protein